MIYLEYAVRAVGFFYALGAIFLIRQMAVSDFLDRAIAAVKLEEQPRKEIIRRWLLSVGAALTGASGVGILLMSSWAVPLFVANLVIQVGWLAWSATSFPPQDQEDALGRRRSFNAAFFYATMTVTACALAYEGRLRPWDELQTAGPTIVATFGYFAYLLRSMGYLTGRKDEAREPPVDDDDFDVEGYKQDAEPRREGEGRSDEPGRPVT